MFRLYLDGILLKENPSIILIRNDNTFYYGGEEYKILDIQLINLDHSPYIYINIHARHK